MWLAFEEVQFENILTFLFSDDSQRAECHLQPPSASVSPCPQGKVEQRKAVLHQGGLGCAFLCVMRTSAGMRLPRGQGASGSGPREAEPVAHLWEEAGAECRAGLAFLSPGHTPWQGSARPIHELLASMLSCSQEFMLHLSSKRNNILGFLITSQRFFSSNISCGHFLPRQSLCLRAPACG